MKTPISYYGGKQRMIGKILPMIPTHITYVEPYCGGASLLFAKKKSKGEIINDIDSRVVNFFRVIKDDFEELQKLIQRTPYSREIYYVAKKVLKAKTDAVTQAWAYWCTTQMSFANTGGAFGFDLDGRGAKNLNNKRGQFLIEYKKRMDDVIIECKNALDVIRIFDRAETFFYIDPPYFNSHMKYCQNQTEKDYEDLLNLLENIKGKFLMSSYPSKILNEYKNKNGWTSDKFEKHVAVSNCIKKTKIEVLTKNYDERQEGLFAISN